MRYFYIILVILFSKIVCAQNLKLADSLMSIGQFNEAINLYKKIDNPIKFFKIAKAYEAKGNNSEAYKNYKQYFEKDSLNINANYNYGLLLIEMSNYDEAQKIFNRLVITNKTASYYYCLGLIFEKQKNNTLAFDSFNEASKIDSLYFKSNYKLSVMHTNKSEFDKALKITNRFLALEKDNIEMLKLRAQIYFSQGNFKEAIVDFKQLILLNQLDEFIFQKLATAYYETQQYQEGISIYTILLEKDEEPDYYLNRGIGYGYLGKLKESESDIKTAIALKSKTFENEYFYLAYFYQKQKDFTKALQYYKKVTKQDPNHSEANYQIIVIKDYFGNSKTETIKEYEHFLNKFKTISAEKKEYINNRIKVLKSQ